MRSDELAPLLAAAGRDAGGELGFHSGTVESWDSGTGHNAVRVGGAVLTDLPILNTGETIALAAGHVVALLRFQSTYFILGRVVMPGTEQFAAAAVAFDSASNFSDGHGYDGSPSTTVSVVLEWPEWADEVALSATGHAAGVNGTSGAVESLGARVRVASATTGVWWEGVRVWSTSAEPGRFASAGASLAVVLARESFPENLVVDLECETVANNWGSDSRNTASISAIGIFRSTV